MIIDYLEPRDPDSLVGLEFNSFGSTERKFNSLSQYCCVSDVRKSLNLSYNTALESNLIDLSAIEKSFGQDIFSFSELRSIHSSKYENFLLRTSELCFITLSRAKEIFSYRREKAKSLISSLSEKEIQNIVNRTKTEIVLCFCEKIGFIFSGKRVFPKFHFNSAKTGRFTTSNLDGFTFGCMSIPEEKRELLTPTNGYMLVVLDFNAIDARSIVSMSELAKQKFADSTDVYSSIFEDIYGRYPDSKERREFKESFFPNVYSSSRSEGLFNEKTQWINDIRKEVFSKNPDAKNEGHALALAAQEQSTKTFCAGISKAFQKLTERRIYPLFTVHDELVLEFKESDLSYLADIINLMTEGATEFSGMKQVINYKIGNNYEECKT